MVVACAQGMANGLRVSVGLGFRFGDGEVDGEIGEIIRSFGS